jgi:hypothetical protein
MAVVRFTNSNKKGVKMILAHHVEIEILDFVHIAPVTMPEHIAFAIVTLSFIGFACYGAVTTIRNVYRWWSSVRGGSLVEHAAGGQ